LGTLHPGVDAHQAAAAARRSRILAPVGTVVSAARG
jgi:hypothetical protein